MCLAAGALGAGWARWPRSQLKSEGKKSKQWVKGGIVRAQAGRRSAARHGQVQGWAGGRARRDANGGCGAGGRLRAAAVRGHKHPTATAQREAAALACPVRRGVPVALPRAGKPSAGSGKDLGCWEDNGAGEAGVRGAGRGYLQRGTAAAGHRLGLAKVLQGSWRCRWASLGTTEGTTGGKQREVTALRHLCSVHPCGGGVWIGEPCSRSGCYTGPSAPGPGGAPLTPPSSRRSPPPRPPSPGEVCGDRRSDPWKNTMEGSHKGGFIQICLEFSGFA